MAGVNVVVKGTTKGTTSDSEGKFAIDVQESDVLVFSFIGHKTVSTEVGNRSIIDITLEEDVASLNEVVISGGYYQTTAKTKTGNISKITAKDIENQPVTSPLMALQGRVPGLEITPNTGVPGDAPKIRIRGENSIRGDGGFPLYVIDGVPVNSSPISTSGLLIGTFDPLGTINPSNIESIEILKDGDATAIYGSRGANGVILITTKNAAKSSGTNLDVSVYKGVGQVSNKLDLLNTQEYLQVRKKAFANDQLDPGSFDYDVNGAWDTTRYTDWQDALLGGTAHITDAQANISGGNSNISFRLGGSLHKETMVFPGDFGYQRATGNLSLSYISSNQKFTSTVSVNYGAQNSKIFSATNLVNNALELPPNAPRLYNDDGNLNWEPLDGSSTWANPLASLKNDHKSTTGNLVANSNFSYEIISGLGLKMNIGYTELNASERIKFPISTLPPEEISSGSRGSANFGNNKRTSWIIEPQATYVKRFENHVINAVVGTTWQQSSSLIQSVNATGYTSDALLGSLRGATTTNFLVDDFSEYKYNALFARIGYNYREKYLLNLTGRRDGSSRFGPGNRFGNFGAIGAAWIFSNESFIHENVSVLNFGKIRASYGTTGNDQIGDYQFYNTYSIHFNNYQNGASLYPSALYNPNFGWEKTTKLEAAIELGFFDNRISFEGSIYRNQSSNLLVEYALPATTGYRSILSNFAALVENSGVELVLNTTNVNTKNFKWTTAINFSRPKNTLKEFSGIETSSYSKQYKVGEPLSVQRLYTYNGVNPQTGIYEVADINDDGSIDDEDKLFTSSLDRKYYGGVNNTIRYKGLEFSFLIQFSSQRAARYFPLAPGFKTNQLKSSLQYWQTEGDVTDVQMPTQNFFPGYMAYFNVAESDFILTDASFVRLKTLSLSYLIPSRISEVAKMQELRVFLQGQNLLVRTDYVNLDPETGSQLPPLRMITIGVQVKF
jgi:TonB-linked SusC/RagA family outer membrane protein